MANHLLTKITENARRGLSLIMSKRKRQAFSGIQKKDICPAAADRK